MKYFRILGMMIITMLITIPVFAKQSIKLDGKWSKSESDWTMNVVNKVVHTSGSSSVTIPVMDMEGECNLSVTDGKNHVFGEFSIN